MEKIEECYKIAKEARALGFDPTDEVEIILASDLAARVEGIVGPVGVSEKIREVGGSRVECAFKIAEKILDGEFGIYSPEKLIEQAVRTGTAILTEGVLVAPTEGIANVRIIQNPDGSNCCAVSYAGPIRAAGGTAAALSVLLADFARKKLKINEWRPTESMVERYVEEINLYDMRSARLQYKPSDEDVRYIVKNCPVMIDGEPTEQIEVSVNRNIPGLTNRVRGGVALVICEGIAQKAAKLQAIAAKLKLGWDWLDEIIKIPKTKEKVEIKENDKFLDEVVAGRPIFSYPSTKGGFRLRYGRTRMSGIAAKAIHPATMIILDGFPAIGTQFKIERPGKGCVVSPCDTIEGPVVKLDDGSVLQVNNIEEAIKLKEKVRNILWLGDMLVTYGDFLKTNTPLFPAGYCEEWWKKDCEEAAKKKKIKIDVDPYNINSYEAFKISRDLEVPLHPRWTYFWKNISGKEVKQLIEWLGNANIEHAFFGEIREMKIQYSPAKEILEKIFFPHKVEKDLIVLDPNDAYALLVTLNLHGHGNLDKKHIENLVASINEDENGLEVVNKISEVKIADKSGTWIGCRMGRPEKSRERLMKPAPHVLFPIGKLGGKTRNIMRIYKKLKKGEIEEKINVEIARFRCKCGNITFRRKCEKCGEITTPERICTKCGKVTSTEIHCGVKTSQSETRPINIIEIIDEAVRKCASGIVPEEVKGVIGMTSDLKIPELIEKGLLRAKHNIFVFKDGTCRFDATNMPLTHFYPKEIGTSIEKLRELGYTKDAYGNELKSEDQLVELLPQDIIVSERCMDYMLRVAQFVDDELQYIYNQKPFYNAKNRDDLIGQLVIHLSPHTSCGIVSRIIGITKARVLYAHPYNFAASRRNCFTPDTLMYYENEGNFHTMSIEEMFNNYQQFTSSTSSIVVDNFGTELIDVSDKNIYVFGTNKKGKFEKKKVKNIIRQPYKGKILKITAENNQEILVTPQHPLWIYNPKTKLLEKKYASELDKNDLLAGLARLAGSKFKSGKEAKNIKTKNDIRILKIKTIEEKSFDGFVYDIELEKSSDKIFAVGKGMILSHNCDGDENSIMLLLDALINFSKSFLPKSRGGTMDAPLVLMSEIDPLEVDDEVHAMEIIKEYPLEFYKATLEYTSPSEIEIKKVIDKLKEKKKEKEKKEKEEERGLWFTHNASSINEGVTVTRYVTLKSMKEKIEAQLNLAVKIAAVNEQNAAERVVLSHFLPDLYGNLRSFARQQFRCVECNAKYRRVPLNGKCRKCGGKLLLTINKGGVEKYLKISQEVATKYNLPHYLKQRLSLIENDIKSLFEDETAKQFNLAEFM